MSDSRPETYEHIHQVQTFLAICIRPPQETEEQKRDRLAYRWIKQHQARGDTVSWHPGGLLICSCGKERDHYHGERASAPAVRP